MLTNEPVFFIKSFVEDKSGCARFKWTKRLYKIYKQNDKVTEGYVNGQTMVLLLLISDSITIPVRFVFYIPEPVLSAWRKEDTRNHNHQYLYKIIPN